MYIEHKNHEMPEVNHEKMSHAGHDHHKMMIADFKKRFSVVLVLAIPVMLLSEMIQHWLNIHISFPGSNYILLALSSIVFFYGGWPFLKGWWDETKVWNPGMMTLIGFAITVAYVYSVATVLGLKGMDFFWELATLILVMLLGHWIEMKSVAGASRELELLVQLMPSESHIVHEGGHVMDVKTDSLKAGDLILVKPGEKVAADGTIAEGESYLNESMLTGESKPVHKIKGDKVIAGAINGNGVIKVSVQHGQADSYLSKVIKLVDDAQKAKSKTQLLADTAARWLTAIALLTGIATFAYWFLDGKDLSFAIERMVTVIVICCPHALGLAVPLVVAKSTALSARHGLLIKNRTAFENSRRITTLVFDKTGTLTVGKFEVVRYQALRSEFSADDILRLAAAVEKGSEHPISTGILQQLNELKIPLPDASDIQALTGKGIAGLVDGEKVMIVSPNYVTEKFGNSTELQEITTSKTLMDIHVNAQDACFTAAPSRGPPDSPDAIKTLHENQIKTILLTGDNKIVAERKAKEVGMDCYFAEVLPH